MVVFVLPFFRQKLKKREKRKKEKKTEKLKNLSKRVCQNVKTRKIYCNYLSFKCTWQYIFPAQCVSIKYALITDVAQCALLTGALRMIIDKVKWKRKCIWLV